MADKPPEKLTRSIHFMDAPSTKRALAEHAKREGRSLGDVVRRVVKLGLAEAEKKGTT